MPWPKWTPELEKVRILEKRAGTGGTTKYTVNHLRNLGVRFQYSFTDLSSLLVAVARRQFSEVEGITFKAMNVEKTPKEERHGRLPRHHFSQLHSPHQEVQTLAE